MEQGTSCRLLELPAELRIRIYEDCLAPTGTLCLTATKFKRYATIPTLAPRLLCTCRQIYTEAQDILLQQNRICLSVDAHDTSWPVISENRLPQHALEKLEHVALILDAATTFYSSYKNIDWTALSALTSLKTLQLSIIWQTAASDPDPAPWMDFYKLLEEVLARITTRTAITYGTKDDSSERTMLDALVERRMRGRASGANAIKVQELTAAEYDELVNVVGDSRRGTLSGCVNDVYAEYREVRMAMFSKSRVEPLSRSQFRQTASQES